MSLNLKSLIGKLNDTTRSVLESAAGLCMSRTHYDIEIEHYLVKALENSDGDIAAILKHFGVDKSRLAAELQRSLDNIKTGNARSPAFSPQLVKMLTEAWALATIEYDAGSVRTGFTLLALLTNEELGAGGERYQPRVAAYRSRRSAQGLLRHRRELPRGPGQRSSLPAEPATPPAAKVRSRARARPRTSTSTPST